MARGTAVALALLLFSLAFGATVYVNKSTACFTPPQTNFDSIQAAIDSAGVASGDTIIVCKTGDPYTENVNIHKSVRIYGSESGVRVNASSSVNSVFNVSATNVQISNFTVSDADSGTSALAVGIRITAAGAKIFGNVVTNNRYGIYVTGTSGADIRSNTVNTSISFGITLDSSSNGNVTANTLSGNSYGVLLLASSDITIANNTATGHSVDGISLQSSSTSNTLLTNTANSNTQSGLSVVDSSSNTLTSNTANSNTADGIWLSNGDSNTLTSNTAQSNGGYGVLLTSGSTGNALTSNTANTNSQSGFSMQGASNDNTLTSNTANSNTFYGFYGTASAGNTLLSNTAQSNVLGYFIAHGSANLSQNNASSSTQAQFAFANASANFTQNRAASTPTSGFDLNITDGSTVTTRSGADYFNFTTDTMAIFFDRAANLTIQMPTTAAAGIDENVCGSVGYAACDLLSYNSQHAVVRLQTTAASAHIDLGIHFDPSDVDVLENDIAVARYSGGWLSLGASERSASLGRVRLDGIQSFSDFGAVGFARTTEEEPDLSFLNLTLTFQCPANALVVRAHTREGTPLPDTTVRLVQLTPFVRALAESFTNVSGEVPFVLEAAAAYRLEAQKPGYASAATEFPYTLCAEEPSLPANESEIVVEPELPPEEEVELPSEEPEAAEPDETARDSEAPFLPPQESETPPGAPPRDSFLLWLALVALIAILLYLFLRRPQ